MKDDVSTQREEALFYDALKVAPSERKAFLDRACGGNSELCAAVEEMLAAQTEVEKFFIESSPALKPEVDASLRSAIEGLGQMLPRWTSSWALGLAPTSFWKKSAKAGAAWFTWRRRRSRCAGSGAQIIKLGMDTKSVIARFDAERQALAMMDHPNIARVLDGGMTSTGRPYFVMELVRGVQITKYCDENNLNTTERLGLFIEICRAVQHAHQKGIITGSQTLQYSGDALRRCARAQSD